MAGSVWSESTAEHTKKLQKERTREKMKQTPVGLGFADRDNYGPDNSYDSVAALSSIRGPEDYTPQ
jgi:hypothetical protein